MIPPDRESSSHCVRIRPAAAADEDATVALWRACGLVVSYNDPHVDFRFAMAGTASDVLIAAETNGRVAGSIMMGHDGTPGMVLLSRNRPGRALARGRRRAGAGGGSLAARAGVRKAQLLVRGSNAGVLGFYERRGYERSDVVVMQRWLDRS